MHAPRVLRGVHSREECLASVELGQAAHSNPIMKPTMNLLKSLPTTVDSTDVQRSSGETRSLPWTRVSALRAARRLNVGDALGVAVARPGT